MSITKLREDVRSWKSRSGWSCDHMSVAIRIMMEGQISPYTISHFLAGRKEINENLAGLLRRFITTYPIVECYSYWHSSHVLPGALGNYAKEDQIRERVQALEEARAKEREHWLAQERKPQKSRFPSGIIPSLEMLRAAYGEVSHG